MFFWMTKLVTNKHNRVDYESALAIIIILLLLSALLVCIIGDIQLCKEWNRTLSHVERTNSTSSHWNSETCKYLPLKQLESPEEFSATEVFYILFYISVVHQWIYTRSEKEKYTHYLILAKQWKSKVREDINWKITS